MAQTGILSSRSVAATPHNSRKIVLLGDSLTSNQAGYTALVARLGTPWYVVNRGVTGNRIPDMAARIGPVISDNRATVIILAGINDVANDATALEIVARLNSLCVVITSCGIKTLLQTLLPFKGSATWNAGRQIVLETVNAWIVASAPVHIRMNTYAEFEGVADTLKAEYDSGDSIHLSAAGYNYLQILDYLWGEWS